MSDYNDQTKFDAEIWLAENVASKFYSTIQNKLTNKGHFTRHGNYAGICNIGHLDVW